MATVNYNPADMETVIANSTTISANITSTADAIDGVISGGTVKTKAYEIYQIDPTDITLQANGCELEVFAIRAYTTELTDDQMLNCHLIDLVNSEVIASEYV